MFIKEAYAQTAGAGGGDFLVSMLPLILIFVVFYFLLIRPQQQKMKAHRAMVGSLQVGTEIVTSGGVLGKVTKVGEQFLTVEVADGVELRVQRNTVGAVMPKGTVKSA